MPVRHVGIPVAVLHVPGEVVPLLDLAEHDLGRRQLAVAEPVEDAVDVVRLDAVQHQQRAAGHPHVDERLLGAEAEAAHRRQLDGEAARLDGRDERVVDGLRAVAGAAGAHAHGDARLARAAASRGRPRGRRRRPRCPGSLIARSPCAASRPRASAPARSRDRGWRGPPRRPARGRTGRSTRRCGS